ncbi:prepilin peptidase [Comamonadaceae bacterium G21597-S1]|nr:prepilin peptidase [Comamonadaceae bacterium G21597-S1]
MAPDLVHLLPAPGPMWGPYPQRGDADKAPPARGLGWRSALGRCRALARAAVPHATQWQALPAPQRPVALGALRTELRRRGLCDATTARALGVVSACACDALGLQPRATQLMAAGALLDNHMAEMATGEGKTLAIAMAAAVAALAGMRVHVVTANDYLARRDAHQMAALFGVLGLRVAALVDAGMDAQARRAAYRHDIVYATAKDLAFDFLRDRQALGPHHRYHHAARSLGTRMAATPPLMQGLCMALLDEADSILLDEADVPLILSQAAPHAARRAFLWQALALARKLDAPQHFTVRPRDRHAALTAAGEARLAQLASALDGPWRRPRYRREAVVAALAALHVFERDTHYLVRDGAIELLDEVTGRVAPGRVWSRGLHTLVALKEGLSPPPETETVAQTTFQRFFQRYWRLCGISGTLREAAAELRAVYGMQVVAIPLHRPSRRRTLPTRLFADRDTLLDAVVQRVQELHGQGRPVLVGTDSVADSQQLSDRLQAAGLAHRVLNALNDAQEADIVARAGQAASVTVATRMAGRGTDIEPDAAALAAGGLHVLSCQHNPSRRLDRQLAGRAARHGDPGSQEHWMAQDAAQAVGMSALSMGAAWPLARNGRIGGHLLDAARRLAQWQEDRRRTTLRRQLLQQDLEWERRLAFAGRST